ENHKSLHRVLKKESDERLMANNSAGFHLNDLSSELSNKQTTSINSLNHSEVDEKDSMVVSNFLDGDERGIDQCFTSVSTSPCHHSTELTINPSLEALPYFDSSYSSPTHEPLISPLGPSPFLYYSPLDEKDSEAVPGVCGLKNLGNTCFLNAGLQCLLNNVHLVENFVNLERTDLDIESFSSAFCELLKKFWSGQYSTLKPSDLKNILGNRYPQFKDFRQHDCQELLALLLDTFHEELNRLNKLCSENHRESTGGNLVEEKSPLSQGIAIELPTAIAHSSGSTSTSPISTASSETCDIFPSTSVRLKPIPENIEPFKVLHQLSENNRLAITKCAEKKTTETINNICNENIFKKNLSPTDCGKIVNKEVKPEKNEIASKDNLSPNKYVMIDDYVKDTKTLNTNVLINEITNNVLTFDSEKFPKLERSNLIENVDNLHSFPTNLLEISSKNLKVKETNLMANNKGNKFHEEKSLLSMDTGVSAALAANDEYSINHIKRIRLECKSENASICKKIKTSPQLVREDDFTEMAMFSDEEAEEEDTVDSSDDSDEDVTSCDRIQLPSDITDRHAIDNALAEREWNNYLSDNKSVVVDTFQGQFKSTVVCSACSHLSVTFEPFMYLPVPLPHAIEQQFSIIYLSVENYDPIKYVVAVQKNLRISDLKKSLMSLTNETNCEIIFAEIYEKHIARILDDAMMLRFINETNRKLYAYKMKKPPLISDDNCTSVPQDQHFDDSEKLKKWESCAICLEETLDTELLCHPSCGCVLCSSCIDISCKHYGGNSLICPVCSEEIYPDRHFVPLNQVSDITSKTRIIATPLLFRHDTVDDQDESKFSKSLFGHPMVLNILATLPAALLRQLVDEHVPVDHAENDYKILFVDGQGLHCSRCSYTSRCSGCSVGCDDVGDITLRPGDNLCVVFQDIAKVEKDRVGQVNEHESVKNLRT
ncbi:Uncharacterised protein PB.1273, partial [Pycnogonum litorale]